MPIDPPELTQVQAIEESGGTSYEINIVEEPLSIEEGYGSLHIEVPQSQTNEKGSVLAIVPVSFEVVLMGVKIHRNKGRHCPFHKSQLD